MSPTQKQKEDYENFMRNRKSSNNPNIASGMRKPSGGSRTYTHTPPKKKQISFNDKLTTSQDKLSDKINASKQTLQDFVKKTGKKTSMNSRPHYIPGGYKYNPSEKEWTDVPRIKSTTWNAERGIQTPDKLVARGVRKNKRFTAPSTSTISTPDRLHRGLIPTREQPNVNATNLQTAMDKAEKYQKHGDTSLKNKIIKKFTDRDYWHKDIKPVLSTVISTLQR